MLQNHANYPYEKDDVVSMLFKSNKYIITPDNILPSTIHQQKLIDTSAKILTVLKNFDKSGITSFTSEIIRIVLISQGITCDTNEIEKSLKLLSEVPFQILQKQQDKYSLTCNIDTMFKRIGLLLDIFNKMGGRI